MELIDAQIHWVDPVTKWSESFTTVQKLEASAELAIASMDAVGVSAALVNATDAMNVAYCNRYPDRFGGVPFARFATAPSLGAPTEYDDSPEQYIAGLVADPGTVGARVIWHTPDRIEALDGGASKDYLAAAERQNLPLFVFAPGQMVGIRKTIEAYPKLTFIIDHVGLPAPPSVSASPSLFDALPDVLELAQFENVSVKFTSVPALSTQAYPFEDLWPPMHRLLDAYGVERVMWGSDFTRCKSMHSYRESVDFLLFTDEVSSSDKEALFSGTIRRLLNWPPTAPHSQLKA